MIGLLSLLALVLAACGASPAAPAATPDSIATPRGRGVGCRGHAHREGAAADRDAQRGSRFSDHAADERAGLPDRSPSADACQHGRADGHIGAGQPSAATADGYPYASAADPTPTRQLPTQTPTTRPNPVAIVVLPVDGSGDDNPNIRNGRNVKNGRNIILPGFAQNEVSSPMIFRDRIVFRVEAFDSKVGNTDGAGIQNVKFVITGPNGEVHNRTENNAGYCVFGGGEPDCDVWVFSPRGNKWPSGKTIENGPHSADDHHHSETRQAGAVVLDI